MILQLAIRLSIYSMVIIQTLGACTYPPEMRQGRYFIRYNAPTPFTRWYMTYEQSTCKQELFATDDPNINPAYTIDYNCIDSFEDANSNHYFLQESSGTRRCSKVTFAGTAFLLQQSHSVASGVSARDCPALIQGDGFWLHRETNLPTSIRWPLPDGTYHVTYTSDLTTQEMCTGDAKSKVKVNEMEAEVKSCYTDLVTIVAPYHGTFTILDTLPGSVLDNNGYGSLYLIAGRLNNINSVRYYCARFRTISSALYELTIYLHNEYEIACKKLNEIEGERHIKYNFKVFVGTTMNPNGTPSPTLPPTLPVITTRKPGLTPPFTGKTIKPTIQQTIKTTLKTIKTPTPSPAPKTSLASTIQETILTSTVKETSLASTQTSTTSSHETTEHPPTTSKTSEQPPTTSKTSEQPTTTPKTTEQPPTTPKTTEQPPTTSPQTTATVKLTTTPAVTSTCGYSFLVNKDNVNYENVNLWHSSAIINNQHMVNYTQTFEGDNLVRKVNGNLLQTISCYDQYTVDGSTFILRHLYNHFQEKQCATYYTTSNSHILLERELDAGISIINAQDCAYDLLQNGKRIRALVNREAIDLNEGSCPDNLPLLTYFGNYQESRGELKCMGNTASKMTVTGSTLNMNLCSGKNTYEQPHQTQLRCVTSWKEDVVDDENGSEDGRGDFLLLSYDDNGYTRYICARYTIKQSVEQVRVYMSFLKNEPNAAICNTASTSKTYGALGGNLYTAYLFYHYTGNFIEPTTRPDGTTPKAPCGPTAGGIDCENGGTCVHVMNEHKCQCSPGFTGIRCETTLPRGDCRNCVTEHKSSCSEYGGYYYCICKQGYIGPQCQADNDECESNPCQNGARCLDGINEYTCACKTGYDGVHCNLVTAKQNDDHTIIIIIVVIIAIILAIIVIVAVALCQMKRRRKEYQDKEIEMADPPKKDGTGDNYSTANAWFADYKQDGSAPTATTKMEMELPEK